MEYYNPELASQMLILVNKKQYIFEQSYAIPQNHVN